MEADGRYSLLMGSTLPDGLPVELFTSGEPRWIGITVHRPGEVEQPRVHLASVPYALKAADADTLGGLPASAYLLADAGDASALQATTRRRARGGSSTCRRRPPARPATWGCSWTAPISATRRSSRAAAPSAWAPPRPATCSTWRSPTATARITGYAVQNLSGAADAYSGMLFYDQNGALGLFQGFNNATHEYRINNIASGGRINFLIGGSSRFLVANNGNIGIGVNPPDFKLHVIDASNTGLRVQTNVAGGTVASFGGSG